MKTAAIFYLCVGALLAALAVHLWPANPLPVVIHPPIAPHPIALLVIEHCGVTGDVLIILSDGTVHEFSAPKTDAERAQAGLWIQKLLVATKGRHYVYRDAVGCV